MQNTVDGVLIGSGTLAEMPVIILLGISAEISFPTIFLPYFLYIFFQHFFSAKIKYPTLAGF